MHAKSEAFTIHAYTYECTTYLCGAMDSELTIVTCRPGVAPRLKCRSDQPSGQPVQTRRQAEERLARDSLSVHDVQRYRFSEVQPVREYRYYRVLLVLRQCIMTSTGSSPARPSTLRMRSPVPSAGKRRGSAETLIVVRCQYCNTWHRASWGVLCDALHCEGDVLLALEHVCSEDAAARRSTHTDARTGATRDEELVG